MMRLRELAAGLGLAAAVMAHGSAARCEAPAAAPPAEAMAAAVAPVRASGASATALEAMARKAAGAYALPPAYFIRLITRESRFDTAAVSRAGAMGISQFMPGTAAARGLSNPFDPSEALPKSAEYLSDLRREFGNLGLAAAAYNAGPARVRRWLSGQSRLSGETLRYVLAITGRDADAWAPVGAKLLRGAADGARSAPDDGGMEAASHRDWELALLFTLAPANARVIAAMKPQPVRHARRDKRAAGRPVSAASLEQKLCTGCIVQTAY